MSTEINCQRCQELRTALSNQTRRARDMEAAQAITKEATRTKEWAEQQMKQAQAEAERQRLRAQAVAAELARYVMHYNVDHLAGCPEDDTCTCPHVEMLNRLLNDYPEAWEASR